MVVVVVVVVEEEEGRKRRSAAAAAVGLGRRPASWWCVWVYVWVCGCVVV